MVVLRCIGPSNFFLERVLFPTDILTFMAPNDSRVEIWGNELYGPKLEERIRISVGNKTLSRKKFDGPIHLKTTILLPSFLYENSTTINKQEVFIKHYLVIKKMYQKSLKLKQFMILVQIVLYFFPDRLIIMHKN